MPPLIVVSQTPEGPLPLQSPMQFPIVWGTGRDMLPSRFAVWFHTRQTFQVYDVDRSAWPNIQLIPTRTSRSNPYFFASDVEYDTRSRSITLYMPRARLHTHINLGIWYTGGWLCKRRESQMQAVIPILGVSDITKLTYVGSTGIYENDEWKSWKSFQAPRYVRDILHNRMDLTHEAEKTKVAGPTPIPEFVASLLVQKAQQDGQTCPITMEDITVGDVGVTSCFHVFQRDALTTWVSQHDSCPLCKQTCSVTHV